MMQTMSERSQKLPLEKKMNEVTYQRYHFGDTDFLVPPRYISLSARGIGAQGAVW